MTMRSHENDKTKGENRTDGGLAKDSLETEECHRCYSTLLPPNKPRSQLSSHRKN